MTDWLELTIRYLGIALLSTICLALIAGTLLCIAFIVVRFTPRLHYGEEQALVNLKFFRGDRDLVATEELCHEVHTALEQRHLNLAVISSEPPDGLGEPVDVRELVANL